MDDELRKEQATSFGNAVDEYERARPTYPQDAVDWLIPAGTRSVLDLGAGTGKFTRSLVARGLEVTAVEPDDEMRAALADALPSVQTLKGTAENIPVPDASVDVITAAQAWHWVDENLALPEAARVLKPGGSLALVWNIRNESVPWVKRLGEIMGDSAAEVAMQQSITIGAPFGPTETFEVGWTRMTNLDELLALVASRSYIITAGDKKRAEVFDGVRELISSDPAVAGRHEFELPYRTFCFRARLLESRIQ
ncbi:class I SAM-dependent methyltransferase [Glaciihabitans sp. UYNi722]|uniref:class I SAM-dependent methyltransferase n=1 Tax=Glaciihabitans sp. UYNi722 TaxID=3156344 RepID=UPI003390C7FB